MKWSLQLHIKAANNESLEEPDDMDKEIELLKRNRKQESVEVQKTRYVLVELSEQIICPMVEKLSAKINKFNTLFMHSYYEIFINDNYVEGMYLKGIFNDYFKLNNSFDSIGIEINFKGYKNAGLNVFDISKKVTFSFQTYKYSLVYLNKSVDFLYHQILSEEQQNRIADEIAKSILEEIKENVV